jgi:hypothetical protein
VFLSCSNGERIRRTVWIMDAEAILTQIRSEQELIHDWATFPLLRGKVITGIVGWVFGIILGILLLVLIVPNVVPINYQHGVLAAVITTILLGVLLFIVIGSIWMMIIDISRLRNSEQYIIVITEQDYIKQEGTKITQIPLSAVQHVTARGRTPIDRTAPTREANTPNAVETLGGFFIGRNNTSKAQRERRKRSRVPSSLAFVDMRTNSEVIVSNDDSFGNPHLIGAELKRRVAAVQITGTL